MFSVTLALSMGTGNTGGKSLRSMTLIVRIISVTCVASDTIAGLLVAINVIMYTF